MGRSFDYDYVTMIPDMRINSFKVDFGEPIKEYKKEAKSDKQIKDEYSERISKDNWVIKHEIKRNQFKYICKRF